MDNILKKILNFMQGFAILMFFYCVSMIFVKILHFAFSPAILGLVLFALALIFGIIKEEWIKNTCNFFIDNMAMFLVPFIAGLLVYKSVLAQNWLVIFLVIFIATTATIVFTGLFVEWGLKFLRLYKIKKSGGKHD